MDEGYARRNEGTSGTASGPIPEDRPSEHSGVEASTDAGDQPAVEDRDIRPTSVRTTPLARLRQRYQGSLAQRFCGRLDELDFGNQIMLLGAGLLISLLPFLILLSVFASERVDDDLALRLGLDHRAAGIVTNLFRAAPASRMPPP